MNWRAFLAYGAVRRWSRWSCPLPGAARAARSLGGACGLRRRRWSFRSLVLMLPTLFASFYASYRDVFGYDAAP